MSDKPRSHAVIRNLPREKQQAIWEYRFGSPPHSQADTLAWLRADGVSTSSGALSNWETHYEMVLDNEANETAVVELTEEFKKKGWIKSAEEEQAAGQIFFTRLAIRQKDNLGFIRVLREQSRLKQIAIERERIEMAKCETFLAWFKDKRARDIAESSASNADKIAKLRQTYFADIEELEKTGEVKIPT
jgi:hypothetical protein